MSNLFTRSKTDLHYLFMKKSQLSPANQRRKKRAVSLVLGIILILVQIVSMVLLLLQIFKLNMLPMNYLIILNVVLVVILLYNILSQFTSANIIGKLLSVILSAAMLFGFFFAARINLTLNEIANKTTTRIDTINVVVLADDSAASIEDTLDYSYGYNTNVNNDIIVKAIDDLNADYSAKLDTAEYHDWDTLLDDLYDNNTIQAMLITNSLYQSLNESYEDFDSKTKIIGTVDITTQVKLSASDKKVNDESFVVYLCGNDEIGDISSTGRTDVNILAFCNPTTKQILLVSTPRDSYITISNSEGRTGLDKLTHASNDGIEYSLEALTNLYGYAPDYYVRINFTGCINIVDALGGITINSDVEFQNGWEAWYNTYQYYIGPNECDGEKTLAFVRERAAFSDGDFQRGKNQQAALKGIIDKATSPAILTNYDAFLSSISNMMLTNMPTETISSLVKAQLNDNTPWNVQSYSLEGTGDIRNCTVYDLANKSVVIPDTDSINLAIQLMSKTINGDVFDVDSYVEEYKANLNQTTTSEY